MANLSLTAAAIDAALGYANNGAAKAYALYNGTTTDKSYNTTSVTDGGAGLFQPNFTNNFADAFYLVGGGGSAESGSQRGGDHCGINASGAGRSTSAAPCANLAAASAVSNAVSLDRLTQGAFMIGDLA